MDGFDNNDIYDSTRFKNKRLKVKITAIKGKQKRTDEIEIKPKYNKVDWVDVRIDKSTKRIDATLRVNLHDGGARGLNEWNKVPKEVIEKCELPTSL